MGKIRETVFHMNCGSIKCSGREQPVTHDQIKHGGVDEDRNRGASFEYRTWIGPPSGVKKKGTIT